MIPWERLPDTSLLLHRQPQVHSDYLSHISTQLRSFPTMREYILHTVYSDSATNPSPFRLTPNAFPYHLEPGVSHHVLWDTSDSPPADCLRFARDAFPKSDYELTLRLNQPHHRSIQNLTHYHVFTRKRSISG